MATTTPTAPSTPRHGTPPYHRAAGQQRDERHQRDEGQVLEQQDREGVAPGPAPQKVALGQHRQHDGGGGEGEAEPEDDCAGPVRAGDVGDDGQQQPAGHELARAQAEHRAAHDPEALRPQFEPDQEQQHDHAQCGDFGDPVNVLHEAEAERADGHAGNEVPEHAAEPEAAGDGDEEDRRGEQRNQGFDHPRCTPACRARPALAAMRSEAGRPRSWSFASGMVSGSLGGARSV